MEGKTPRAPMPGLMHFTSYSESSGLPAYAVSLYSIVRLKHLTGSIDQFSQAGPMSWL